MWGYLVARAVVRGLYKTTVVVTSRVLVSAARWMEAARRLRTGVAEIWDGGRRLIRGIWGLHQPHRTDVLRWPVVRRFSDWFGQQDTFAQVMLITLSLATGFLLAVAAGYTVVRPPSMPTAKAEASSHELTSVLYEWLAQRPALPSTKCGPEVLPAACGQRLAAGAEQWQARFAAYVAALQAEQWYAQWRREGKDFPAYDRGAGILTFTLGLEGAVRADGKTCLPFRVIAELPQGITAGLWPDQGNYNTKPKPFPHPCLRATEWIARVRVEPETAQIWMDRARQQGWKVEMFFHLDKAESPLRPNWDEDARLTDDDFLKEQRIWLWVDEVRLVIGGTVVHRWR